MTTERFNELLEGPLHHPIFPLLINRVVAALFFVVQSTGQAGEDALEVYCRDRQARDESQG